MKLARTGDCARFCDVREKVSQIQRKISWNIFVEEILNVHRKSKLWSPLVAFAVDIIKNFEDFHVKMAQKLMALEAQNYLQERLYIKTFYLKGSIKFQACVIIVFCLQNRKISSDHKP